jgi:hypothetical protein
MVREHGERAHRSRYRRLLPSGALAETVTMVDGVTGRYPRRRFDNAADMPNDMAAACMNYAVEDQAARRDGWNPMDRSLAATFTGSRSNALR